MASPFPNFDVGDIVDVSLVGGGMLDEHVITFVPTNQPPNNENYWELYDPQKDTHVIVGDFISMVKKP